MRFFKRFRNNNTNLRSTEDSNRTALGGQYRVGTENGLRIPVNCSEKIRASYVARASVGENPRPQPVLPYAETKFTSLLRRRQLLRCLRNEHPASPPLTRTTATFAPGHATHFGSPRGLACKLKRAIYHLAQHVFRHLHMVTESGNE